MFVHFEFLSTPANAAGIAVIHSLFNIGCVIILFPFSNLLVKLATLSIPDGKHEEVIQTGVAANLAALDERFLETPGSCDGVMQEYGCEDGTFVTESAR